MSENKQKDIEIYQFLIEQPSEEIHSNERDCNAMQSDLKRK